MGQKRTAGRGALKLSPCPMKTFPDHPQSPFTGSRTKYVPGLRDVLEEPASDKLSPQYDVPALKALALNHIRSELAKCDIVHEAFSRFASR